MWASISRSAAPREWFARRLKDPRHGHSDGSTTSRKLVQTIRSNEHRTTTIYTVSPRLSDKIAWKSLPPKFTKLLRENPKKSQRLSKFRINYHSRQKFQNYLPKLLYRFEERLEKFAKLLEYCKRKSQTYRNNLKNRKYQKFGRIRKFVSKPWSVTESEILVSIRIGV